jgi:flagellar protein FlaG
MDTINPIQGMKAVTLPAWQRGQGGQGSEDAAKPASDPSAEGVVRLASQGQVVAPATKSEDATLAGREGPSGKHQVEEAVKNVNDFLQVVRRSLQFKLDDETGHMIVQIKDEETGEVIRQIPREEVVKFAKELDRLKGLLFEGKV